MEQRAHTCPAKREAPARACACGWHGLVLAGRRKARCRRTGRHRSSTAPFDPVVWDRRRFELLWNWAYRFEAYTPVPKRRWGYYALPLLWREGVIGWARASVAGRALILMLATSPGSRHPIVDSVRHWPRSTLVCARFSASPLTRREAAGNAHDPDSLRLSLGSLDAGHLVFIDPQSDVWPRVMTSVRRLLSLP